MREELQKASKDIEFDNDKEHTDLLEAFTNKSISHMDFLKMLKDCKEEKSLRKLRRVLSKI